MGQHLRAEGGAVARALGMRKAGAASCASAAQRRTRLAVQAVQQQAPGGVAEGGLAVAQRLQKRRQQRRSVAHKGARRRRQVRAQSSQRSFANLWAGGGRAAGSVS